MGVFTLLLMKKPIQGGVGRANLLPTSRSKAAAIMGLAVVLLMSGAAHAQFLRLLEDGELIGKIARYGSQVGKAPTTWTFLAEMAQALDTKAKVSGGAPCASAPKDLGCIDASLERLAQLEARVSACQSVDTDMTPGLPPKVVQCMYSRAFDYIEQEESLPRPMQSRLNEWRELHPMAKEREAALKGLAATERNSRLQAINRSLGIQAIYWSARSAGYTWPEAMDAFIRRGAE
jgi:hypothetical protein